MDDTNRCFLYGRREGVTNLCQVLPYSMQNKHERVDFNIKQQYIFTTKKDELLCAVDVKYVFFATLLEKIEDEN